MMGSSIQHAVVAAWNALLQRHDSQRNAPQPPLLVLAVVILIAPRGLKFLTSVLWVLLPTSNRLCEDHADLFQLGFFVTDASIKVLIVWAAIRYYGPALYAGFTYSVQSSLFGCATAVLCASPFLVAMLNRTADAIQHLTRMEYQLQHPEAAEAVETHFIPWLGELIEQAWSPWAYSVDVMGMVLTSVILIIGPFVEEVLFTGFLYNRLSRRFGIFLGAVLCAMCFVLLHITPQIVTKDVVQLGALSLCAIGIRLLTGCYVFGIVFHVLYNTGTLVGRWILALMGFSLGLL